jgi:23S rRNA (cytidine1920-2'-O)/16S rRNA (cytidine1409-2'-O)-methyltransferase
VADVSFISLGLVLPALKGLLAPQAMAELVVLVKPQFEVGKGNLHQGVVRDDVLRTGALRAVCDAIVALGLPISGVMASPLDGEHGNREAIVYGDPTMPLDAREWENHAASIWGG